jgi:hypothetical protein
MAAATLIGGLAGSFGLNLFAQRAAISRLIERMRWWGVGLYYLLVAAAAFGGFLGIVRFAIANADDPTALDSPFLFLAFGFIVGLPFTLPTVTGIWRRVHGKLATTRTKPATRQERTKFATDLEGQLREFVEGSREVHLDVQGDDGDVLVFGGEFTRQEGERLVAALRGDLKDLDIKRVEGGGPGNKWWVRVEPSRAATKRKKGGATSG